ncbi:Lysine--tRNA ligase [Bienertia sinuspersici]
MFLLIPQTLLHSNSLLLIIFWFFLLFSSMASSIAVATSPSCSSSISSSHYSPHFQFSKLMKKFPSPLLNQRKTLVCAANQDAEEAFKKTVEVDRLIDTLKDANPKELQQLVAENVLAFNEGFWIRLAARTDTCKSEDDKKDYEELAATLMTTVDLLVHKTNEKIESSTDVLKSILKHAMEEDQEVTWPPRDPQTFSRMEQELNQREQEGYLDEGFLSEVNAQLRQAKEDGDKPGLIAMLQKVLQLYAARVLSKRSYAKKGNEILKAEQFLEAVIKAPENEWNTLLLNGLTIAKGDVSPEEFYAVINKRIERVLIRTEGGSYQQRILTEYLKGIQSRTEELVQALQGNPQ